MNNTYPLIVVLLFVVPASILFLHLTSYSHYAPLHAPSDARGMLETNIFLNTIECVLMIEWQESPSPVAYYRVYNGTTILGEVSPKDPLTFWTHVDENIITHGFSVTAVDTQGVESAHKQVSIE